MRLAEYGHVPWQGSSLLLGCWALDVGCWKLKCFNVIGSRFRRQGSVDRVQMLMGLVERPTPNAQVRMERDA